MSRRILVEFTDDRPGDISATARGLATAFDNLDTLAYSLRGLRSMLERHPHLYELVLAEATRALAGSPAIEDLGDVVDGGTESVLRRILGVETARRGEGTEVAS